MKQLEVAYAGISGVGGHHTFDSYAILVGGGTEEVSKLRTDWNPSITTITIRWLSAISRNKKLGPAPRLP